MHPIIRAILPVLSFALLIPFAAVAAIAGDSGCAEAAQESQRTGRPILLVFGAEDCGYCDRLERELLDPEVRNGALKDEVVIQEIDIDGTGRMEDFDGESVRSRIFVDRYKVFATPTVVLVNPQGEVIGDPIVGYDNAGDYRIRLEERLRAARGAGIASRL